MGLITSLQRRWHWTAEKKRALVEEAEQPGMSISLVARKYQIHPSQLFRWRRLVHGFCNVGSLMSRKCDALPKADREYGFPLKEGPEQSEKPIEADAQTEQEPDLQVVPAWYRPPFPVEAFRGLRRNLLNGSLMTRSLVFASSTAREGCSTVLISFAVTLAAAGERVTLVDANLYRPSLHQMLGVEEQEGLHELLRKNKKKGIRHFLKETGHENLSLITAGQISSSTLCPFESNSFNAMIDQLRPLADWLLFDSPAINVADDVLVLAPRMDGVVLVVRAGKARREVVQDAVDRLRDCKANILGVILNGRKMPIPDWIYRRL